MEIQEHEIMIDILSPGEGMQIAQHWFRKCLYFSCQKALSQYMNEWAHFSKGISQQ